MNNIKFPKFTPISKVQKIESENIEVQELKQDKYIIKIINESEVE